MVPDPNERQTGEYKITKRDYKKITGTFMVVLIINSLFVYGSYYMMRKDKQKLSKDAIIQQVWTTLLIHNALFMLMVLVNFFLIFSKKIEYKWNISEHSNYGSVVNV